MGQYYKDRKIGTCECMYYMRLEEAQKLAALGVADDDGIKFADYLKDNETRWRFPFPDEDKKLPEFYEPYDKGFAIPAGCLSDIGHGNITIWNEDFNKQHGCNIFIPCLHSKEFGDSGIKLSYGGAGEQYLIVRFQAIRNGQEKTIFDCARCGQSQRFSDDDIEKLKEHATEHFATFDRTGKDVNRFGELRAEQTRRDDRDDADNQSIFDYAMEIIKRIK